MRGAPFAANRISLELGCCITLKQLRPSEKFDRISSQIGMNCDFSSPRSPLSNTHTDQSQLGTRLRLAADTPAIAGCSRLLAIVVALALSGGKRAEGGPCDEREFNQEEGWSTGATPLRLPGVS